ncbi:MAG: hypothetical protein AAF557_06325 [Pseudomonadota bacterium]
MRFLKAGLLIFLTAIPAQTKPVYQGSCEGAFSGVSLGGQLRVDYLSRHSTYAYRGVFYDAGRNRYDFEVITNQSKGVGGAWKNGMRHRESRIDFQISGKTFTIADTDHGGSGRFVCR